MKIIQIPYIIFQTTSHFAFKFCKLPQLKIKSQIMASRWAFGKDSLNSEKFCEWFTIKYDIIDYGVTMDLQKKSRNETGESYPHWLKITLWKELGRLVQKYKINIWILFQRWG